MVWWSPRTCFCCKWFKYLLYYCVCRLPVQQGGALPCPRVAHQLVYDAHQDTYYMFGGKSQADSTKVHASTMRLDDLWTLKVSTQYLSIFEVRAMILSNFRSIDVTESTSSRNASCLSENRSEWILSLFVSISHAHTLIRCCITGILCQEKLLFAMWLVKFLVSINKQVYCILDFVSWLLKSLQELFTTSKPSSVTWSIRITPQKENR